MSKYTTELRYICESITGLSESKGYNDVNEIIEQAVPLIFNFDFPIFDSNYKPTLLKKIIKHYYTREICEETYGLWKLRLENKLNEIMPYYNQLYETTIYNINPIHDTDFIRTYTKDNNDTNNANTTNLNAFAETPQGSLQDLDTNEYLTSANKTNNEYKDNRIGNEKFEERVQGKLGTISYGKLLNEYREAIINIDLQIIDELNILFMQLY